MCSEYIQSLYSEVIALPEVSYTAQSTNTIEVIIPNDDNNLNNSASIDFDKAPAGTGLATMVLEVDNRGSDIRWYVYDSNGTSVYHGGPYPNNAPQTITENFTLVADCYEFKILDTASNGGGEITITDSKGTELYHTAGNYGNAEHSPFSSDGVMGVNHNQLKNISLYPNPATSILNVTNTENANIQVFGILGN